MGGLFNPDVGILGGNTSKTGVANYNGKVLLSTSIDIIDELGNGIGYISQITPASSRPSTRIRGLGSRDAGRVLEQAPSPEDVTVQATGFALYRRPKAGSIIERLATNQGVGFNVIASLEEQKIGFKIRIRQVDPKTNVDLEIIEYQDCWLINHSTPFNIATATVSETVSINVSRIERIL